MVGTFANASDIMAGNGRALFGLSAMLRNYAEDAVDVADAGPILVFDNFDELWTAHGVGAETSDPVRAELNLKLKNKKKDDKNDWSRCQDDSAYASKLEWSPSRQVWEEVSGTEVLDGMTKDRVAKELGV